MLVPVFRKKFKKDLHRMLKRGKSEAKIKVVISKLLNQEPLDQELIRIYSNNPQVACEVDDRLRKLTRLFVRGFQQIKDNLFRKIPPAGKHFFNQRLYL